jgi:hypothetical protein
MDEGKCIMSFPISTRDTTNKILLGLSNPEMRLAWHAASMEKMRNRSEMLF